MRSLITVHPDFDRQWPLAADHFHALWRAAGEVVFHRLDDDDERTLGELAGADGNDIVRAVALGVTITPGCLDALPALRELACNRMLDEAVEQRLREREIVSYRQVDEGFWGESVAECALALTLCGLRRIPQKHHAILSAHDEWHYGPPGGKGRPGARGIQFGDDPDFANGTVTGKRVRIVGAGNIASRYASFVSMLGADVAAWDPFAAAPCFHRSGARREWHLDQLVQDADIFAPMVPLNDSTRNLVPAELIDALPRGCLVVCVTRMPVVDCDALRRRVLADELALAADVFDVEPLPFDDPLLGRHNVVHTPHIAGRTVHANQQWAEQLAVQFAPLPAGKPLAV